jgi:SAM-dependent methyltransferase
MVVPDRIIWAVNILDVRPDDIILEVGCGNGAAISLICGRLVNGHIMAIDRSEKMIAIARKNNREFLKSGKADILHGSIETSELPSNFSKIFLFNLNVFWMDPVAELAAVGRALTASGKLYIFHNPPPGSRLEEFAEAIAGNLDKNGFDPDPPMYNRDIQSLCIRSVSRR